MRRWASRITTGHLRRRLSRNFLQTDALIFGDDVGGNFYEHHPAHVGFEMSNALLKIADAAGLAAQWIVSQEFIRRLGEGQHSLCPVLAGKPVVSFLQLAPALLFGFLCQRFTGSLCTLADEVVREVKLVPPDSSALKHTHFDISFLRPLNCCEIDESCNSSPCPITHPDRKWSSMPGDGTQIPYCGLCARSFILSWLNRRVRS